MWPGSQRVCKDARPHDPHIIYSEPFDVRGPDDEVLYRVEEQMLGSCRGVREHVIVVEP
jgi:hypothetical protein